jgi:hypothetical protein
VNSTLVGIVVGAVLGGGFALVGQWFQSRHESDRAREARADERKEVRAARREAFELTQLDQLDAAALRLSAAVLNYRATQPRLTEITDTPEGNEFHAARREVRTLLSRTLDQKVRNELSALAGKSFATATETSSRYAFELVAQVDQLREAIGARIRTLYEHDGS